MPPSYKLLAELFGTDRRSKPYKALRRNVSEEPVLFQYDPSPILEYRFHQYGFNVSYNLSRRQFDCAHVMATQYEQYSVYQGDLPNGVSVSNKKIEVCERLGEPLDSGRTRRGLPIPHDADKEEWKEFLARQSAEPFTEEWCVFRVEDCEFRFWFDDDLEGRMTSMTLSRHLLLGKAFQDEVVRLVKELKELEIEIKLKQQKRKPRAR